jgi:hypothetical protein
VIEILLTGRVRALTIPDMKNLLRALTLVALVGAAIGCGNKSAPAAGSEPGPEPARTSSIAQGKPAGNETGAASPTPAAVDPGVMGPDGLPASIPAPGSAAPTVADWNGVTKEVTVKGSSALGCETKMLREWLRVSCHPKGSLTPTDVKTESSGGQQAFAGMFGKTASVVVQVVKGRDYNARYTWDDKGKKTSAKLLVEWPSDHPRPVISLKQE